jgi:hypothetical protein
LPSVSRQLNFMFVDNIKTQYSDSQLYARFRKLTLLVILVMQVRQLFSGLYW